MARRLRWIASGVMLWVAGALGAGVSPRTPWTTSRIAGTPEPPRPFVAEQLRPELRFTEALELVAVPGTDRFIAAERRGKVSTFSLQGDAETPDLVIDLLALHPKLDDVFGVALHPKFRGTREIFICYALQDGQPDGTKVSRFKLTSLEPLRADPASEEIVLDWRSGGHNGGNLQFGPDGYLYISTGDSGPAAPPDIYNTGQDVTDFMGSILRVDIDRRASGKNYAVPADNPWASPVGSSANGQPVPRPELWAYGLRNPWKISFDRATGNLWCGDVGWEMWEMIHLIKRGGNYGWSAYEASQPIKPELANPLAPVTPPVVAHSHSEAASMTGGFVYHGKRFPELANAYVYGDYVTGKIWALWHDGKAIVRHEELADTPHAIITFGQTDDGELYYLHYPGRSTLHRLVRNPQAAPTAPFPRTLGATGLFADVAAQRPEKGVYPFAVGSPMWEDGSTARRWIALRDSSNVSTTMRLQRAERANQNRPEYTTTWPRGAVLVRTIALGQMALKPEERTKPVETQVLHFDGEDWNAYAYRWNEAGTDADLVPAGGAEMTIRVAADPNALGGGSRDYTWRFQSRAECLRCHSSRMNGALAFTPTQLKAAGAPQMNSLIDHGIVDANFFEQTRVGGEAVAGEHGSARAVLQANCAHCHTAHAGGSVSIFLNQELLTPQMNIVGVPPTQGGFGVANPRVVAPGDPWNSVLAVRMAKSAGGHMPLIGAREVDVEGLKLVEDWIARMPSDEPAPRPWEETKWNEKSVGEALATVAGAMRVRRSIDDGKLDADARAVAFRTAWASPQATIREIFERFKPDEQRERTLGATVDPAAILGLRGDPERGAKLVASDGKLASCQACHFIRGHGRQVGPDLSRIGAQQNSGQILDSIIAPSKTVAPLYRTTIFECRDGTTAMGFVRARGANEIVLTILTGQSVKLRHADILTEKTLTTSLMPEGQLAGLTPQEAADLVAYLTILH